MSKGKANSSWFIAGVVGVIASFFKHGEQELFLSLAALICLGVWSILNRIDENSK